MDNGIKNPRSHTSWWQCGLVTLVALARLTETRHSSKGVEYFLVLPTLFVFGSSGPCYDCLLAPALAAAKC